jgi:hypothetical protein
LLFFLVFCVLSYYGSLRSEFRVVITISAQKLYSVGLYLLFVGGTMSYIRYLCLFVHSGVQHILCCVFALFVFVLCLLHAALDCTFLIAPSVFSNVYPTKPC